MSTRTIYISNAEVELDGSRDCMAHLAAHAMEDRLAVHAMQDRVATGKGRSYYEVLELGFNDEGKLASARILFPQKSEDICLPDGAENITIEDVPRRSLYRIEKSDVVTGARIGGLPPENFEFPQFQKTAPFQYVATLSSTLKGLEWLPFDLHLTLPTLNFFGDLRFDYRNPKSPRLLEGADIGDLIFQPTEITTGAVIANLQLTAKEMAVTTELAEGWSDEGWGKGHVGIPDWVQLPEIPICPENGFPMAFVCELSGRGLVDWIDSAPLTFEQVRPLVVNRWPDFPHLVFYVFLAPLSRTVFITAQGT